MSPATKADICIFTTEGEISKEVAGASPTGGIATWEEWWENRYRTWRKNSTPEAGEFCIRYTKTRRQQMGLPIYEPGPFEPVPTKRLRSDLRKESTIRFTSSVTWPTSLEKQDQPPPAYADTWPGYWKHRYVMLDRYVDLELAAAHRKIIHKERGKARLPLYDPLPVAK